MAKREMKTPGAPAAARTNRKRGQVDPTETSGTRQTMGVEAYRLVDDASATAIRQGFTEARPEKEDIESVMGVAARRPQVSAQERLGPGFRVQASRAAYDETYPSTLANGRVLSTRSGLTDSFRAPDLTGSPISGSSRPRGSWSPPRP